MDSQPDFEDIRKYLSAFKGGAVTLSKNNETGIATLVLNRSEKRNALSGQMMVEFRNCVEELEQWSVGKGVILRGEGNFCAGGDLDFARATGSNSGFYMSTWMQDALERFWALPIFSVCLISGSVLGGGAEISMFADFIIATDDVRYGFVQGKLGIITAWCGGTRLCQRLGHQKALDLLLSSKVLNADECLQIGLAECVVPTSEAIIKTEEWVAERTQHHFTVTRAFKQLTHKARSASFLHSHAYEKNAFLPFWGAELNQNALCRNIKHQ